MRVRRALGEMRMRLIFAIFISITINSGCSLLETSATVGLASGHVVSQSSKEAAAQIAPTLYADEINITELKSTICTTLDSKFGNRWYYMGSDDEYDYVVTYPFIKSQQIYKILRGALFLNQTFEVTQNKNDWITIVKYNYMNPANNHFHWQLECNASTSSNLKFGDFSPNKSFQQDK
jgi:hypothetical protein